MVAKIYDMTKKGFKEPEFEAAVLKTYRPNGSYTISLGPIVIEMDAADKQNLIDEWTLCEKLIGEWRAQGKVADYEDDAFMQFLTAGHRR